jgi:hypothetical protein
MMVTPIRGGCVIQPGRPFELSSTAGRSSSNSVMFFHLRHNLRIRELVRCLDRNDALGRHM